MNYSVHWTPVAENRLASIWLSASDRNEVTQAAHQIDLRLQSDPLHTGESRQSSVLRFTFEPPLGIEFEVIEDDKKVRVLTVWQTS
jgi:plasmid stabilization system protein ParE